MNGHVNSSRVLPRETRGTAEVRGLLNLLPSLPKFADIAQAAVGLLRASRQWVLANGLWWVSSTVGVPLIWPFDPFRLRPVGSDPTVTDHV